MTRGTEFERGLIERHPEAADMSRDLRRSLVGYLTVNTGEERLVARRELADEIVQQTELKDGVTALLIAVEELVARAHADTKTVAQTFARHVNPHGRNVTELDRIIYGL